MSIVSCGSCGMQFNAAGYEPGVQFQCTQCGGMVTVGAAAPAGRPGAKRATGVQKRGPGGPRAMGGPAQGRQAQGGQQQQQPYAPAKKSSTGMIIGVIVGVAVVGILIAVVVMSSGPSPQQAVQEKTKSAVDTQKEVIAKKDAETAAKNDGIKRTIKAAMDRGPTIESALRNSDKAALEGMFDWTTYAAYLGDLSRGADGPKYMASGPLFSSGEWYMDGPTPKWKGKAVHGPESLKAEVMGYIEKHLFGSPEVLWQRAATEDEKKGGFGALKINGREYLGKFIFVEMKGTGKTKEFWVGAPVGDEAVKIINFVDKSAITTLQQEYAKANRPVVDDRNPIRDDRLPPDEPTEPEGDDPVDDGPKAEDLPAVAKTGAMPTDAPLVNILNQLKDGNKLKEAQKKTITTSKAEEKKAMLGALTDALIDAHNSGKRREKAMISDALFQVWGNFARNEGYDSPDMVYAVEGAQQSDSDEPIKRWILVYNKYPSK